MRYHLLLFLFLIDISGGVNAGELVDSLYGIPLGKHLDSLVGEKHKQKGVVRIKGIKHQMYMLDSSIYKLAPPFDRLLVQVEMETLKIKGVVATAEITDVECKIRSTELKKKVEDKNGISFKEFEHQGDIFYLHEGEGVFMSIGCQNKHNSVLQYQIGTSS